MSKKTVKNVKLSKALKASWAKRKAAASNGTSVTEDKDVIATLEITVEYAELPERDDIDAIIEQCRANGHVAKGELTIHRPTKRSIL